jgi:hypothetical protein
MKTFCVEFDQDLILEYQTLDTDLANRWYDLLRVVLSQDATLREADRLQDFPNSIWTESVVVNKINACLETISHHVSGISDRAVLGGSRAQLNLLHKHFEELRGGVLTPSTHWQQGTEQLRTAINDLNLHIHRLEDILDAESNPEPWPHVIITFNNFQRLPLQSTDYALFTTDTEFGTVYLNYCEVGKALWNVFFDADDVVGDHNIRPLRYYSPEMMLAFYDADLHDTLPKFWSWWDDHTEHLAQLGFHRDDPDLSIGAVPVARLKNHWDRKDLINAISEYDSVKRVYIP